MKPKYKSRRLARSIAKAKAEKAGHKSLDIQVRRPTRMVIAGEFSCGLVLRKNVRGSLF